MAEENVNVKFGASIDEMLRGISSMTSQFQSSINGMKGQLAGLQEVGLAVQRVFLGVTAVLGGGALFGKAVRETEQFIFANMEMARHMGISVSQAGIMSLALKDAELSTSTLEQATNLLQRQLATNEDKITKFGVATRNSNGTFRNTVDILLDVNKKLLTFKEGTDRNVEAVKAYGRGWAQVQDIIKLTPAQLKEIEERARPLGLIITEQNIRMWEQWDAAMDQAALVSQGLSKVVGEALMPILTNLGNWFNDTGPTQVSLFRVAINALATVMWVLVATVQVIAEILNGVFESIASNLGRLAQVIAMMLTGNVAGATALLLATVGQDAGKIEKIIDGVVARVKGAQKAISELWNPDQTPANKKTDSGGGSDGEGMSGKSRMATWQQQWDYFVAVQDNALQDMTAAEEKFWGHLLNTGLLTTEELIQVTLKLGEIKKRTQKAEYDAQVAALQEELSLETQSLENKQAIAQQIQNLASETYGAESKEAQRAYNEVVRIWTQRAEEKRRIDIETNGQAVAHGLGRIEMERQTMEAQVQLGRLTASERIAAERAILTEEYALKRAALEEQLQWTGQLTKEDTLKLHGEIEALDTEHALKLQKNQLDQIQANVNYWESLLSPIQNAISTSVQGLILGTTTWKAAFQNLGVSILASFIDMLAKMGIHWAAMQLGMTGATASGAASRFAIEAGAAAKSVALWAATAIKNIANFAWEAAAGAYKAIAGIPYVGPFLAPAAAVAALAAVGGMAKNIVSAEGGWWQVPGDQLASLHKNEMVIPADRAAGLRNLTEGGPSGRGGDTHLHIHSTYADADGIRRMFMNHGKELGRGIQNHVRNFGMLTIP